MTVKRRKKPYDIHERVFEFSLRVLEISKMIPNSDTSDVIRNQFVRSGTSIGANLEESDGVITKKDFINKIVLARKEAKETRYWLRLFKETYLNKHQIDDVIEEINEILKILSAIINNTKNK